ncbi:MAG: hypothetical protein HKP30_17040 [Myxococcales bacterium]|nr:hypothetical protein [Myxococcales bacterium]
MRPSEVRRHVLSDHAHLRERLTRIVRYAGAVVRGGSAPAGVLRMEGEALLEFMEQHMSYEDQHLVPILREADAWGDVREERFAAEHREQRELLAYALAQLVEPSRPERVVAQMLLDLAELLEKDMHEEEAAFLDPRIVRDDPITIDLFAG